MKMTKASGITKLFMKVMGFEFMAFPYDKIYYIKNKPVGRWLKHECKHLEQYKREGVLKYFIIWWWEYLTIGYDNIRYEIEAKEAEYGL